MIKELLTAMFKPRTVSQSSPDFERRAEELRQARGELAQTTVKFERALHDFDVLHKNALKILDEGDYR